MTAYLVRRLVLLIPTIIGISLTIHVAIRLLPGDIVVQISEGRYTAEQEAAVRKQLGLDDNAAVAYAKWVGNLFQGDLGHGIINKRDVRSDIARRMPVTFELAVIAVAFSTLIAIPIGVLSAVKQDTWVDHLGRSFSVALVAIPSFWLALLFLTYGYNWFGWLPPIKYVDLWDDPVENLKMMIVPGFVLSGYFSGTVMRLTRSTMLEVLRQDYVRTARAKGLGSRMVILRHAMRNAIIPVITVIGVQIPVLLGGTVILETIFVLPGIGTYLISSLQIRDYPIIQGVVLITALIVVVTNIIVDLSYSIIDPRVRYG